MRRPVLILTGFFIALAAYGYSIWPPIGIYLGLFGAGVILVFWNEVER